MANLRFVLKCCNLCFWRINTIYLNIKKLSRLFSLSHIIFVTQKIRINLSSRIRNVGFHLRPSFEYFRNIYLPATIVRRAKVETSGNPPVSMVTARDRRVGSAIITSKGIWYSTNSLTHPYRRKVYKSVSKISINMFFVKCFTKLYCHISIRRIWNNKKVSVIISVSKSSRVSEKIV